MAEAENQGRGTKENLRELGCAMAGVISSMRRIQALMEQNGQFSLPAARQIELAKINARTDAYKMSVAIGKYGFTMDDFFGPQKDPPKNAEQPKEEGSDVNTPGLSQLPSADISLTFGYNPENPPKIKAGIDTWFSNFKMFLVAMVNEFNKDRTKNNFTIWDLPERTSDLVKETLTKELQSLANDTGYNIRIKIEYPTDDGTKVGSSITEVYEPKQRKDNERPE